MSIIKGYPENTKVAYILITDYLKQMRRQDTMLIAFHGPNFTE